MHIATFYFPHKVHLSRTIKKRSAYIMKKVLFLIAFINIFIILSGCNNSSLSLNQIENDLISSDILGDAKIEKITIIRSQKKEIDKVGTYVVGINYKNKYLDKYNIYELQYDYYDNGDWVLKSHSPIDEDNWTKKLYAGCDNDFLVDRMAPFEINKDKIINDETAIEDGYEEKEIEINLSTPFVKASGTVNIPLEFDFSAEKWTTPQPSYPEEVNMNFEIDLKRTWIRADISNDELFIINFFDGYNWKAEYTTPSGETQEVDGVLRFAFWNVGSGLILSETSDNSNYHIFAIDPYTLELTSWKNGYKYKLKGEMQKVEEPEVKINTDLFADVGLTYSELLKKRGKLVETMGTGGGIGFRFENGYGFHTWGDDALDYDGVPLKGVKSQKIELVQVKDLFLGIAKSVTNIEIEKRYGVKFDETGDGHSNGFEYCHYFVYKEDIIIAIFNNRKNRIDLSDERMDVTVFNRIYFEWR